MAIKDRLLTYNRTLNDAFRRIDGDSTGYVSSAEIKNFFRDAYLGDVVNDRTLAAMIDVRALRALAAYIHPPHGPLATSATQHPTTRHMAHAAWSDGGVSDGGHGWQRRD